MFKHIEFYCFHRNKTTPFLTNSVETTLMSVNKNSTISYLYCSKEYATTYLKSYENGNNNQVRTVRNPCPQKN